MVRRWTVNPCNVGSSPTSSAKLLGYSEMVITLGFDSGIIGSNPISPARISIEGRYLGGAYVVAYISLLSENGCYRLLARYFSGRMRVS